VPDALLNISSSQIELGDTQARSGRSRTSRRAIRRPKRRIAPKRRLAWRALIDSFASRIVAWQARQGRHDLPWQNTRDPYRIWLSEIMLQQTQVAAVIRTTSGSSPRSRPAGARRGAARARARAVERARLLQPRANLPSLRDRDRREARRRIPARRRARRGAAGHRPLDGRGDLRVRLRRTRGAILDGNVKRVLARHAGIDGFPGERAVESALWSLATARMADAGCEAYTQA
jgi:A/G-specific adenine glycosylase